MMVCALIQISPMDGCPKGWDFFKQMEECGISALLSSLSLCFPQGGKGEAEAQTQATLSALRGMEPGRERTEWAERVKSRFLYVMLLRHSQILRYRDSPGGGDRTLHFHIHL
ncbi:hypothetical protein CHARACLAT_008992 [Characodon lateralis]|uniref:Uncharacterized protein n=1 Tax=Characodon lateralis TaxID=208331 RepID=A0ABU7DRU4_9TELE|nr:hypothetical protein [Characodon lateralis]